MSKQLELFANELELIVTPPSFQSSCDKRRMQWEYLRSKNFGLEYCKNAELCGKYGIPKLPAYRDEIPERFISLSDINRYPLRGCCVAGLEYDWLLERLWYQFDYFVPFSRESYCVTNPDFSLYADSPLCVQIANAYRSHAIGFASYEAGAKLLPLVQWSSTVSLEFAFDGYSKGGVVLVPTIGTNRNERSQMYFIAGFNKMLKEIDPEMVVLYGDVSERCLLQIPKQLPYKIVPHYRFERARKHGR